MLASGPLVSYWQSNASYNNRFDDLMQRFGRRFCALLADGAAA